jgi:hypothetical protein
MMIFLNIAFDTVDSVNYNYLPEGMYCIEDYYHCSVDNSENYFNGVRNLVTEGKIGYGQRRKVFVLGLTVILMRSY